MTRFEAVTDGVEVRDGAERVAVAGLSAKDAKALAKQYGKEARRR